MREHNDRPGHSWLRRWQRTVTTLGVLLTTLGAATLGTAQAGSACTTVYGTRVSGGTYTSVYYDPYANTYNTLGNTPTTAPNAAALDPATGRMYYVDQTSNALYYYDPTTKAFSASLGTVPAPAPGNTAPALTSTNTSPRIIGATFAANGNLYVLYSSLNAGRTYVGQINAASGALVGTYNELKSNGNAVVSPTTNGDIATNGTTDYAVVEPNAIPTIYAVNLGTGVLSSPVQLKLGGATLTNTTTTVNGLAYNPVTRQYYVNLSSSTITANNGLFLLDIGTGTLTDPNSGATFSGITDLASCGVVPDVPTLAKSFTPATVTSAPANTTLTLTFGNTNTAPYYLTKDLTDTFPTTPGQMVVASTPALAGTCLAASGSTQGNAALVTTAAGDKQLTVKAGLVIPVGGCTVTVAVTAPALGAYTNTIASGAVQTTAGNTLVAANAVLTVQATPALSIVKTHAPATLAAAGQGTYTLTVTNAAAASGTTRLSTSGTVTVTDTLPATLGIAPVSGFQVVSNGVTWTCSYVDELTSTYKTSGQTVTCTTTGAIAPSVSTAISFAVTVLPDATGTISNTASVSGGGDPYNGGAVPTSATCDATHCSTDTAPVTALPTPPTTCSTGTTTNLLSTPNTTAFYNQDTGTVSTPVTLVTNAAAYRQGVGTASAYIVDMDWWFNNGTPNPSNASTLSLYVNGTEYARLTGNAGLGGAAQITALNGAAVSATWVNRGYYQGVYPKVESYVTLPTSVAGVSSAELRFTGGTSGTSDDIGFNVRAINACVKPVAQVSAVKTVQNISTGGAVGSNSSGKPGEILEYCIVTTNTGTLNTTKLAFSDTVPGNTSARSAAYGTNQDIKLILPSGTTYATFAADTDAGQLGGGAIAVNLPTLVLTPGQTFTVCFRATIG